MEKIEIAREKIQNATAILIGAGAGLTDGAGLKHDGEEFKRDFADYISRYGFRDLYSAGFHPFPSQEEFWSFWARHAAFMGINPLALPLYAKLKQLVENKNYFVITTNVDRQFYKAGFGEEKIFAVQGDMSRIQCAKPCAHVVYEGREIFNTIIANSANLKARTGDVPVCPSCGGPMTMHLRIDQNFVEDQHWHEMEDNYKKFLARYSQKNLVMLEIGVGFNTPGIIRFPFEALAAASPNAVLIRINKNDEPMRYHELDNIITFQEDAQKVISELAISS